MLKRHNTEYEAWWQGADGRWRLAKLFTRADRLMEYLRTFMERYPDVQIVAHKKWTIRHCIFQMRTDGKPERYPEPTLNTQITFDDSPTTDNGATDSGPTVSTEPLPGRRDGGEGTQEGNDDQCAGEAGRSDVDCKEPPRSGVKESM